MTVAPEMFNDQHALRALQSADQVLRGPLGMKTLDPTDLQYRPVYDNANDSSDPAIAKGLNYHNVCLFPCSLDIWLTMHNRRVLNGVGHWGTFCVPITILRYVKEEARRYVGSIRLDMICLLIICVGHKECPISSPSDLALASPSYSK